MRLSSAGFSLVSTPSRSEGDILIVGQDVVGLEFHDDADWYFDFAVGPHDLCLSPGRQPLVFGRSKSAVSYLWAPTNHPGISGPISLAHQRRSHTRHGTSKPVSCLYMSDSCVRCDFPPGRATTAHRTRMYDEHAFMV